MAKSDAGRAFEAGVKAALEFLKTVDWTQVRRQLAESAQSVLVALEKTKKG